MVQLSMRSNISYRIFAQRTAEPKSNEKTMGEGARKRKQREKKEHWWLWWGKRPANYHLLVYHVLLQWIQQKKKIYAIAKDKDKNFILAR